MIYFTQYGLSMVASFFFDLVIRMVVRINTPLQDIGDSRVTFMTENETVCIKVRSSVALGFQ